MSRIAAYTSFTFTYLSRALVLAHSLRAAHPDWMICACIVDTPPPGIDCAPALAAFDQVVYANELGIPNFESWIFKHDLVEACTAVKGHALSFLLAEGYELVFYFDPDIAVFHSLDAIMERLDTASIVLTPHQVMPSADYLTFRDNELTSMKCGIYNLGFIAVRNSPVGVRFASWWAQLLYEACYDDPANGIFTDQKYIDLVPALFDEVDIFRAAGCNVASWNLTNRTLNISRDGTITVNGDPLKFYHFTKINGAGDVMTAKYIGENSAVWEVWNWYKREIAKFDTPGVPKGYWAFGRFANNVPISKPIRILFRTRAGLIAHFANPFAMHDDCFYRWLSVEHPDLIAA